MKLEHIQIFITVAECGSFTAAAEKLYVTHSTVSRSIAALEAELGTALFQRSSRGVRPTPAGEVFLAGGERLIAEAKALKRRVKEKGEEICENERDS